MRSRANKKTVRNFLSGNFEKMAAILKNISDKVILFFSPTCNKDYAAKRIWKLFAES